MPPKKRATSTKPPGDFTGRQLEKAQEEAAQAEVDRSKELTMAAAQQQEIADNTIVDLSDPTRPVVEDAPLGFGGEVEDEVNVGVEEVEEIIEQENVGTPMVVIRVNGDLKTNIGYDNYYEFESGRRYRVPLHIAQHLDEKGWLFH